MADKIFPTDFSPYVPSFGSPVVSADRLLLYRNGVTDIVAMDPVAWYSTLSKPAPSRIVVGNALAGDTLATCNYLDPGDGSGIKAAVDAAVLSGVRVVVWVREGVYTFLAANMLTTAPLVSVRGVHRDRVVFVCPSQAGQRQTVAVLGADTGLSDVTISLTVNTAAIVGGGNLGYFALYTRDNSRVQRVKFTCDATAGNGPVLAMLGRFEAGAPQEIIVEDSEFSLLNPGATMSGMYIGTADASLTVARYGLRAARLRGTCTGTLGPNGFLLSDCPAIVSDLQQTGFAYAYASTTNFSGAVTTIPPYIYSNIREDVTGQADQAYNNIQVTGVGNPVLAAMCIENHSRKSNAPGGGVIDARYLRVVCDTVTVQGLTVRDITFTGSGAATGGIELRCVNTATFDSTLVADVTCKGLVRLATLNPSTGPWTNTVISGVVCADMSPPEYSQNMAISGCSISGTLTIGNSSTNTWVGASVRYGTLVDNGSSTHIGTRHHRHTSNPLVTDDSSGGYQVGDMWTNTAVNTWYVCTNNGVGAAVWLVVLTNSTATPGPLKSYGTNNLGAIGFYDPSLFESTGVLSGFALSINGGDNTKFDLAAGIAGFVDYSINPVQPTRSVLQYAGGTALTVPNIGVQNVSYVGINGAGTVLQQATPFTNTQRRTIAPLGLLVHSNHINLNAVNTILGPIRAGINQLHDYLEYRGPLSKGVVFGANGANLNMNRTSGSVFKFGANFQTSPLDPHVVSIASQTALTFRYRTQTGAEGPDVTAIVPGSYDNAGTLTAVSPSNRFTVQRITVFQSGLTRVQYGQQTYASLDTALANFQSDPFVVETNIADNGIFRGWLIVQGNATDLSNPAQARFIAASSTGTPSSPGVPLASTDDLAQGAVNFYYTDIRANGGIQNVSGSTTVGTGITLCLVTANANISLPTPTQGRRITFKKATASSLASVVIVRAGSENIENVAANYSATTFNTSNYAVLVFRCDGTNWWLEHVS